MDLAAGVFHDAAADGEAEATGMLGTSTEERLEDAVAEFVLREVLEMD